MEKRNALKTIGTLGLSGALLPKVWTKPIVNSVLLPAHAMTSNCSVSDIVGEWTFAFGDPPDDLVPINFFANGTGELIDNSPVTWTLSMDRLIVSVPVFSSVYDGVIDSTCSTITGIDTSNNDPFTATRSIPP